MKLEGASQWWTPSHPVGRAALCLPRSISGPRSHSVGSIVRTPVLPLRLYKISPVSLLRTSKSHTPFIPEMRPLGVSDLSKKALNFWTSSGINGGTLIGGFAGGGLEEPVSEARNGGMSVRPSNRGRGPATHQTTLVKLRLKQTDSPSKHIQWSASSSVGTRPACACPINLSTTENPEGVRKPLFSLSAICHICGWQSQPVSKPRLQQNRLRASQRTTPSVSGGNLVFSKNGTANSPVTTPRPVLSAAWNSW